MTLRALFGVLVWLVSIGTAGAATPAWPTQEGDFVVHDFRFASGETLAELRLHYLTLGTARRDAAGLVTNAVLVLHGTGGDGRQFLRPQFANELYGPGQPLDITRYYVILPDGIGHGHSSKPSDGAHARFPPYGYTDMVEAQHRLLVDGLGVGHLRLLMGTSMGCMHGFLWAEQYPAFMDGLMPLACLPVQIAGRNRMWRRMIIDAIREDPAWKGGDYETEPTGALRTASALLMIAGSAPVWWQSEWPTRDTADRRVAEYTAGSLPSLDANDLLYQVGASRDYDPSPALPSIAAPVLWINSADDFINPPELGIAEAQAKRLRHGRFVLLPASTTTRGHGSHTWAALWKDELVSFLQATEPAAGR